MSEFPKPEELLSEEFLSQYKNKEPNWGFNGLGQFVYARTYSRLKKNGEQERWYETVERCIKGAQEIGAGYSKEEAERLYGYIFNLKCSFGGRSLWQLGTDKVRKFGANSLINCFYTNIETLEDFCFIFENLMMGCGVGASVRKEHIYHLPKVKLVDIIHLDRNDADFIVPDSREGWVELLRKVLTAIFLTGRGFTYSTILVRPYGEPIQGFGGTASGPKILIDGITNIVNICNQRAGKKLRSIDCLDIFNIIASIVVAGNIRRSSEIALGDADDILFLKAKRWDLGGIPNWRAMSNNTIVADNYDYTSPLFWEGYKGNGEPYGLFNLKLSQTQGRLGEHIKDSCEGTNPCCFAADQDYYVIVKTNDGFKYKELKQVVYGDQLWIDEARGWGDCIAGYTTFGEAEVFELDIKNYQDEYRILQVTKNHRFDTNYGLMTVEEICKFPDNIYIKSSSPPNEKGYFHSSCRIISCKYVGKKLVGCIEIRKHHCFHVNGIVSGNSEISLNDGESCNLSDLFLNNISSQEELIDCAKLLYKTQKAICALSYLHEKTNKIVHKNMRIGIGVTGVCQSLAKLDWLDACYKVIRKFDKQWSKQRGWHESIKISTLKPSGTLSLLSGSTPGIHPAFARYYIRRVRIATLDPLVKLYKAAGYKVEFVEKFDKSIDETTSIVEFPCKVDDTTIIAEDMSAVQQLELVKRLQTIWADNAVSCTVYYTKDELPIIQDWLSKNYDKSIKAISFLLRENHGFSQPPYESISKEEYFILINKIRPITNLDNQLSNFQLENLECQSGACPIK